MVPRGTFKISQYLSFENWEYIYKLTGDEMNLQDLQTFTIIMAPNCAQWNALDSAKKAM